MEVLSGKQRTLLKEVTAHFAFSSNDYYLSLIDWNDPADPIRRIIVPDMEELQQWGRLDPSDEGAYTVMPGLEHKYKSTVLLLISNACGGICRYCFRKRVFMERDGQYLHDVPKAIHYIRSHPEITNVLLTGGDPLMLPTEKLAGIIAELNRIDHVQIIRVGTRMPVFNPYRIIDDPDLLSMINTFSTPQKRIYIMTHFCHPNEFTQASVEALDLLLSSGAVIANQCPLIRGVNDDPVVLAELFRMVASQGLAPYYLFQCRPAVGNFAYTVPIEEGFDIFEAAKSRISGLAKRARFVMSHTTGKIEIVGKAEGFMYFKYHRAERDDDSGQFLVYRSNPDARWLDDYDEVLGDYPASLPYRLYGPE